MQFNTSSAISLTLILLRTLTYNNLFHENTFRQLGQTGSLLHTKHVKSSVSVNRILAGNYNS